MSNYDYYGPDGVGLHGYCARRAEKGHTTGDRFVHHEWVRFGRDSEDKYTGVFCDWCGRPRREVEETRPLAYFRPLIFDYTRRTQYRWVHERL